MKRVFVLLTAAFVALPLSAVAGTVDECMRSCSANNCDFDPSDPGRAASCREKAESCKWECQLNGNNSSSSHRQNFAAIAYSPSAKAHGYSYDYGDRASAEAAALDACAKQGHTNDCIIAVWFYDNCGALATASDGTWGGGYARNQLGAQTYALSYCRQNGGKDCSIQKSYCVK